jgi:hypothetical protein
MSACGPINYTQHFVSSALSVLERNVGTRLSAHLIIRLTCLLVGECFRLSNDLITAPAALRTEIPTDGRRLLLHVCVCVRVCVCVCVVRLGGPTSSQSFRFRFQLSADEINRSPSSAAFRRRVITCEMLQRQH